MAVKPSFRFAEIYLLESNFKRPASSDFNDPDFKSNANILVEHQIIENKTLQVTVTLDFSAGKSRPGKSRTKEITAKIKMMGVFFCEPDPVPSVEQFAKANGPAIMFPFLREHLASITLKAGISQILLPAVNFIRLSQDNKVKNKVASS